VYYIFLNTQKQIQNTNNQLFKIKVGFKKQWFFGKELPFLTLGYVYSL